MWSKAIGANPTLKFQPLNPLRWIAFFLQMSNQWRLWPLYDILFECYWWEYGKSYQLMVFKEMINKKIKSNHKACIIYYCIRHTVKLYVAIFAALCPPRILMLIGSMKKSFTLISLAKIVFMVQSAMMSFTMT